MTRRHLLAGALAAPLAAKVPKLGEATFTPMTVLAQLRDARLLRSSRPRLRAWSARLEATAGMRSDLRAFSRACARHKLRVAR